jgi:F-type H+-transporting ATPase subunit b
MAKPGMHRVWPAAAVLLGAALAWPDAAIVHAAPAAAAPSKEADDHGAPKAGRGAADDPHAADGHGGGHGPNTGPLGVDPDLAIWTAVVFLILLLVLWKFAWGPIAAALEHREEHVADQIAAAERSNQEARDMLARYETQLANAGVTIREMLDQARRDAEASKQKIIEEAREAAQSERKRALQEIEGAKDEALRQLAEKSVELAIDLAGKIVRRELKPDDHARLIKESLTDFPSRN